MNNNKVLKAGFWYTICNFFVKGLTIITTPIFTRIMTSEDIGLFSNITSWFSLLAIVTTFEIYSSVSIARFDYKNDLDSYISSSLILGSIITFIFYMLVLVFSEFFMNLFMMDFLTLNLVFIYLLVYPSIQMYQIKNQINYDYKSTIKVTLISSILSTLTSITLTLSIIGGLKGRIIGYFVPLIICCLVIYFKLLRKGKKISKKYWKYALTISFPLIWHLLAGYILSSSDRIMITKILSPDDNALYSVAYTLSMVVFLLWSSMNNAWSPWAYEQMDKKDYAKLKKYSKPYTIFFLLIVFCFLLISPELLYILGGKYYYQARFIIPPVMIGYVFQFIYSLYVNIEFYHKKQKNIAIGTIIAAITNIVLNFLLLERFGYIAAAYTTLIGYILLAIIHYLFVKKLKCDTWYSIKFFSIVAILSLISIILFNILYMINYVRYIIVALLFIFVIIYLLRNKSDIIDAISEKSFDRLISIFSKKKGNTK